MKIDWMVSSSAMILLVMLIRFVFRKKMQPYLRYALWFAVALRLLVPISFSTTAVSVLNLLPMQTLTEAGQEGLSVNSLSDGVENHLEMDIKPISNSPQGISWESVDIQEEKGVEGEKQIAKGTPYLREGRINTAHLVRFLWLAGAVFLEILLLMVNLDYGRRLRRSRRRIAKEKLPGEVNIPVYISEIVQTPCLFGLFRPSIYVTEKVAEEEKTLAFVLCHEKIHFGHRDNWWAFVRNLCLCLHWYNPLVWMAAYLCRQDCELACDEKALKVLGGESRVDYGRVLLELSTAKFSGVDGWRISTTMGGSKRQLAERLQMIVDAPKKIWELRILLLIFMALVFAVAFTGRNGQSLAAESQSENQSESQSENYGESHGEAYTETEDLIEMQEQEEEFLAEDTEWVPSSIKSGQNLVLDLNFDGYDDLCLPGQYSGGENMPYYCMLWNQQTHEYEKNVMLYNVDTDKENEWITSRVKAENGCYSTTYYRYDKGNQLHMVRYVEEDVSPDAVFGKLDLTYVEDEDSIYMLPAIVDETDFHRTLFAMAKHALMELYQWTGEKVDTACFTVSNMGDVFFGVTPEDIRHSRTFYDRAFGSDTDYNLSNYDKSISSMYVLSGRSVWYSPVLWRIFPDGINEMTDEEIIIWYLEKCPLARNSKVKSVEKRYEDMWTIQTEAGVWFEVAYDVKLKEVTHIYGPYPDYPVH